jgi:chromosome segregation ATPase
LQADNATLKVQIKRLESMHTKKLDPAKKLVQTHEDVLKAKQEEIGKLRISNIKADLLIEKLVARLDNLHAENQVLKQSNKIMKDNVAARESDKESLIVEREGLRIANEDLSFRVSNLLAGQAKLRTKIEALEKEVNETKEKMQAHSQMVKDEDLDF